MIKFAKANKGINRQRYNGQYEQTEIDFDAPL